MKKLTITNTSRRDHDFLLPAKGPTFAKIPAGGKAVFEQFSDHEVREIIEHHRRYGLRRHDERQEGGHGDLIVETLPTAASGLVYEIEGDPRAEGCQTGA